MAMANYEAPQVENFALRPVDINSNNKPAARGSVSLI